MSKPARRGRINHLIELVTPVAAAAKLARQERNSQLRNLQVEAEAKAEERRQNEPHPLDVAIAKFHADNKAAAEKDTFVVTAQTEVFVSGDVLRKNKDEAARAIRKNKSSSEMVADMQRQERKENE